MTFQQFMIYAQGQVTLALCLCRRVRNPDGEQEPLLGWLAKEGGAIFSAVIFIHATISVQTNKLAYLPHMEVSSTWLGTSHAAVGPVNLFRFDQFDLVYRDG